jgi:hypothetical protein
MERQGAEIVTTKMMMAKWIDTAGHRIFRQILQMDQIVWGRVPGSLPACQPECRCESKAPGYV